MKGSGRKRGGGGQIMAILFLWPKKSDLNDFVDDNTIAATCKKSEHLKKNQNQQ